MKRFLPPIITLLVVTGVIWYGRQPVPNPDPNHTHADFAVWVDGKQLDFSGPEFMSGLSTDDSTHDEEGEYHDKYLHLHDGNGHVAHSHKPGLTFGDFLESIGFSIEVKNDSTDMHVSRSCVTLPNARFFCDGADVQPSQGWQVLVNNAPIGCRREGRNIVCGGPNETPFNRQSDIVDTWNYVFQDGDKILLSYGPFFEPGEEGISPDTREMRREWAIMTDDACLYSKTCPWRGPAPTENCIADPLVPCIAL